jgi:purine-binding chemotaxis protein CheW
MSEQLFLIAQVAGRPVAIDTAQVESVVDIGAIVEVPRAAGHVRGLAALRSRVVTVIDTVAALGIAGRSDAGTRAVITQVDGHHYALLVEGLEDVMPLALQPLATGAPLGEAWTRASCGLVERDGEPILALDLAALIHAQPAPAAH